MKKAIAVLTVMAVLILGGLPVQAGLLRETGKGVKVAAKVAYHAAKATGRFAKKVLY